MIIVLYKIFSPARSIPEIPVIPPAEVLFESAGIGDAMRIAQDHMDAKNFYGYNPAFDKKKK